MKAEITMRELIVIVLCFALYVVSVEVYQSRIDASRQGQLARQAQSFVYVPPPPPVSDDGVTVVTQPHGIK
jgi:hypothetical protein